MLANKNWNMNLYTYWEGEKPAYIKLCQDSLKNSGMNVVMMSKDDYPELNYLKINHKTDYLKAKLVYENGGFWIDADMVVMKDLKPLISLVEKHGFAGIPGFFGAVKGNEMVGRWLKEMEELIKKEITFSDLIQPLLKDKDFKEFGVFTKEMICPIYHTGDEFWKLFENLNIDEYSTENNYVFTLYNSQFSQEVRNMNEEELLNKNWLMSKVFRKALCEYVQ